MLEPLVDVTLPPLNILTMRGIFPTLPPFEIVLRLKNTAGLFKKARFASTLTDFEINLVT